ncbi:MAG: fabE [Burkholderiaceae bacterium]|nr:fabE [Burkholderiaceae bacterium]
MDLRKLKTLIDLVAESDIAELEVTEGESKVRIIKSNPQASQPMMIQAQPGTTQYVQIPTGAPAAAAPAPAAPAAAAPEEIQGHVVKSPMVGTFYAASAPGNPPYVTVGASVQVGDTLCIIEAMKLLNEIDAEVAGVVKQILVENGQPVEYGQPLFIIG